MKKLLFLQLTLISLFISTTGITQEISPYILVGESPNSLDETEKTVNDKMRAAGFEKCRYHNLAGGIVALHIGYKV